MLSPGKGGSAPVYVYVYGHALGHATYERHRPEQTLLPKPKGNLTRYHGVLAPNHRWREEVTKKFVGIALFVPGLEGERKRSTKPAMPVLTEGTARAIFHHFRTRGYFLDGQLLPTPHEYFLYLHQSWYCRLSHSPQSKSSACWQPALDGESFASLDAHLLLFFLMPTSTAGNYTAVCFSPNNAECTPMLNATHRLTNCGHSPTGSTKSRPILSNMVWSLQVILGTCGKEVFYFIKDGLLSWAQITLKPLVRGRCSDPKTIRRNIALL